MIYKTWKLHSIIIVVTISIISCSTTFKEVRSTKTTSTFNKLEWFIGTWKGYENGQPFYESWRRINDTLIANYEITINKNDTTIDEGSSFRLIGERIILGDPKSIHWKVDSIDNDYVRVKNDTLKSNKVITWKHSQNDHWLTIGSSGAIRYDMIRTPLLDNAVIEKLKIDRKN